MEHALYYREQYYLLPEPYATVEEFLTALGLLLMDPCDFLKALHFRAPLLHTYGARCWVYDQYEPRCYEISFDMEQVPEEDSSR